MTIPSLVKSKFPLMVFMLSNVAPPDYSLCEPPMAIPGAAPRDPALQTAELCWRWHRCCKGSTARLGCMPSSGPAGLLLQHSAARASGCIVGTDRCATALAAASQSLLLRAAVGADWGGWWDDPSTVLCAVLTPAMALSPDFKGQTILLPCRNAGAWHEMCTRADENLSQVAWLMWSQQWCNNLSDMCGNCIWLERSHAIVCLLIANPPPFLLVAGNQDTFSLKTNYMVGFAIDDNGTKNVSPSLPVPQPCCCWYQAAAACEGIQCVGTLLPPPSLSPKCHVAPPEGLLACGIYSLAWDACHAPHKLPVILCTCRSPAGDPFHG